MEHSEGQWVSIRNIKMGSKHYDFGVAVLPKGQPPDLIAVTYNEADSKIMALGPELLEALEEIVHGDDPDCKCRGCKIGKPLIKKATA